MASTIQIKRGTGSAVPSGLADGELAINLDNRRLYFGSGSTSVNDFSFGEITAEKYIVSSSVLYVTTSFSSGSTEFGDTADDTHTFTGNITSSGNISSSAYIYADRYYSNNQLALNNIGGAITLGYNNTYPINIGKSTNPITLIGHVTASGNISASGTIIASNLSGTNTGDQDLSSYSTITQLNASSSTLQTNIDAKAPIANPSFTGNITASGNVSASGDIIGDKLFMRNHLAVAETSNTIAFGFENNTPIQIGKVGNPTTFIGHVTASGNISSSGKIYSGEFYGEGDPSAIGSRVIEATTTEHNFGSAARITKMLGTAITLNAPVTASGNISASGTIFTDTLSSPVNNLSIPSSTVTITAGTAGDANLILQSDTDNSDEADNAFMTFEQDGGAIRSYIGHTGADDEYPDATVFTGGLSNHLVIAHSGSDGSRGMQFGTGNNARVTINTDGEVGIGNNDPGKTLDVTGEIRASGNITANGNIIGDGATQITGIDKIAGTTDDILEITSDSDIIYKTDDDGDELGEHIFKERTTTLLTLAQASASFAVPVKDGGRTIVKILPHNFVANDGGRPVQIEDDSIGSNELFLHSHADFDMYAYIEIPYGMTATHVKIFGSNTGENFTVYEADITNKTIAAKCSATAVGSEADITDVPWTDANYLVILVTSAGATDEIHGGYVKIEPS